MPLLALIFLFRLYLSHFKLDFDCEKAKLAFCQAQFQLASSVQVQLRTEISLIITVRPGKYILSLKLTMRLIESRLMVSGCLGAIESDFGWSGIASKVSIPA